MLVLTRKSNQSIMIGDEIEVSVLSVMGEKVRIGIQAPQEVPVFRKEIYLEIHREAGAAAPENDGRSARAAPEGDTSRPAGMDDSLRELGEGGQPKRR
jgi:carbon storage regulator